MTDTQLTDYLTLAAEAKGLPEEVRHVVQRWDQAVEASNALLAERDQLAAENERLRAEVAEKNRTLIMWQEVATDRDNLFAENVRLRALNESQFKFRSAANSKNE